MSIESNLKRTADALEQIVELLKSGTPNTETVKAITELETLAIPKPPVQENVTPVSAPVVPVEPPVQTAPQPPSDPVAPASSSNTPDVGSVVTPPMSVTDLNAALQAEAKRVEPSRIFEVMKAAPFSVASVNNLKPEQYQPLIDAVKALV